jgi:gliding motility-associated-like protein
MKLFGFISFLIFIGTLRLYSQESYVNDDKFKFIENKGQWPDFVLFRAETKQSKIYLEQGRILYHFMDLADMHKAHAKEFKGEPKIRQELIAARFVGSRDVKNVVSSKPAKQYYNYFIGNDKSKWASNVMAFADVLLKDVYPGVDLRYNNQGAFLKYDFIVAPSVDPSIIQIEYQNARSIAINKKGRLVIRGEIGFIEEEKPYAYQVVNGRIVEVECEFTLVKGVVSYRLGSYDKSLELIIDPELVFASYSGSLSDNFGMTATYDSKGNLYSGGTVFGNSYPTTAGAFDENGTLTQVNPAANLALVYGVTDVFISKYSADGTDLIYSTYIGGGNDLGGTDVVHSLICNDMDELYFFGTTSSSNFPLVNPVQSVFNGGVFRIFTSMGAHYWGNNQSLANGGTDLFIAKLSANGSSLLASTYYGGSQNDGLNYNEIGINNGNTYGQLVFNYGDPLRGEIMLDQEGNVYIASCTYSSDFPLVNASQSVYRGNQDGVLLKFNPELTNVLWSTYWGGTGRDACYAIKFDSNGNVFVAGGTMSVDFPTTTGVFQTTHAGTAFADGFVTKFNSSLSVTSSTFIGTGEYDQTYFLQLDNFDDVYVLGQTLGLMSPTPGKYANPNSGQFIMKLNNNLSAQYWQTVFGNGNSLVNISPTAFLVDICGTGNLYVTGWGAGIAGSLHQATPLTNMPVTPDAFQVSSGDGFNFYLIVLAQEAEGLIYGSYLGGGSAAEHVDGGTSRFDKRGVIYHSACGGCGGHSDFPTFPSDVWSSTNNSSNCNNLVFKFDFKILPQSNFTSNTTEGCAPLTVNFQNFSSDLTNFTWDFGDGVVVDDIINPTHIFTEPGIYQAMLVIFDDFCDVSDTSLVTITVYEPPAAVLSISDLSGCIPLEVHFTNLSNDTLNTNVRWYFGDGNYIDNINNLIYTYNETGVFEVALVVTNPICAISDSVTATIIVSELLLDVPEQYYLCNTSSGILEVSSMGTADAFYWSSNSGFTDNLTNLINDSTLVVDLSNLGWIYVKIQNQWCELIDSVEIIFVGLPDANFISPNGGCAPLTVAFQNNSTDFTDVIWSFGDGSPTSTEINPVHTFNMLGVFEITLEVFHDQCSFSAITSTTVSVFDFLFLDIPDEIFACNVQDTLITINSFGTGEFFIFSSNSNFTDTLNLSILDSTLLVSNIQAGMFYVKVYRENCEQIDSVRISFIEERLDLLPPPIICLGQQTTISAGGLNPSLSYTFNWFPDSAIVYGDNTQIVTVSPNSSQFVFITATTNNGCVIHDSVFVQVNFIPDGSINASAVPDSVPKIGALIQLLGEAPGNFSTFWSPASSVNDHLALSTSTFVNQNSTFYFIVTDENGACVDSIPVFVRTHEVYCVEPYLFIPNAFSPNGDGNNDIVYVRGAYIENMIFRIYNRWGEMVFESRDPQKGWDGKFNGKLCEPDVYDYYLDAECIGGLKNLIKGNITLVR